MAPSTLELDHGVGNSLQNVAGMLGKEARDGDGAGIGGGAFTFATWGGGDVDEAAGVDIALVGAALGRLGLLLGLNLGGLRLDLAWARLSASCRVERE